jgi:DNA-binding NtrC family response regulator
MARINADGKDQPEWQHKIISPKAKNILLQYEWPGNVRELHHTLLRAAIWSQHAEISEEDIQRNLLSMPKRCRKRTRTDVDQGFDLQLLLDQVERHYIQKAFKRSAGKRNQRQNY